MTTIRLLREPSYAPCSFIVARAPFDPYDDPNTVLVQTDWDFPSLAREFGWNMQGEECDHSGTDGTITCPECGKTATDFISEAFDWLLANVGAEATDPGYFD